MQFHLHHSFSENIFTVNKLAFSEEKICFMGKFVTIVTKQPLRASIFGSPLSASDLGWEGKCERTYDGILIVSHGDVLHVN